MTFKTFFRWLTIPALCLLTLTLACGPTAPSAPRDGNDAPSFVSVSAGFAGHTCGVKSDGSAACWDLDLDGNVLGQATPLQGSFVSVSTGGYQTYGMRSDGSVARVSSDGSVGIWSEDKFVSVNAPGVATPAG